MYYIVFFFQAEDGIRYLVRSRGLGDVYKRQVLGSGEARARLLSIGFRDPDGAMRHLAALTQGTSLSLIHI